MTRTRTGFHFKGSRWCDAAGKTGKVNVHFTVSTEHRELFTKLVEEKVAVYAKKYGVEYDVSFSEQKPSTDTVAADMENKPFRDKGKLLFRPGGTVR